jgi:hypothetical protein
MTVQRFTRLTNAFSKKIENHGAAVALGYFAYNFIKIHRTLRVTPAMACRGDGSAVGGGRLGCGLGSQRAEDGKSGVSFSNDGIYQQEARPACRDFC